MFEGNRPKMLFAAAASAAALALPAAAQTQIQPQTTTVSQLTVSASASTSTPDISPQWYVKKEQPATPVEPKFSVIGPNDRLFTSQDPDHSGWFANYRGDSKGIGGRIEGRIQGHDGSLAFGIMEREKFPFPVSPPHGAKNGRFQATIIQGTLLLGSKSGHPAPR